MTTARESVERYSASCLAGRKRKVDSSLRDYSEDTRTIREQNRFAGSIVEVERVVRISALASSGGVVKKEAKEKKKNSNSTESSSSDVNNTTSFNPISGISLPKPQGIDSLLNQIASEPQKLSTVQKKRCRLGTFQGSCRFRRRIGNVDCVFLLWWLMKTE